MIVIFKSAAAGDVIMFGDVAHRLMKIMGKDVTPKGIVTIEQLPGAIALLEAAIAEDRKQNAKVAEEDRPLMESGGGGGAARPFVTLAQRAVPLLELLSLAQKKKKPVTWGV